jgi:hypothetical protein
MKAPDLNAAGGPFNGTVIPITPPARPGPPSWIPFPVEALPPACRRLVLEASAARGVDPAFIGVPMLPVLAGAIGNARLLRLKRAYSEPAVLWAALVQRSGTIKSAGLDDVLRPHRERNRDLLDETRRAFDEYEQNMARHRKTKNDLLPAPVRPRHLTVAVDDVTAEALIVRLADNPRGLLLGVDELAGLIASFDAYKHARGADVNKFLTMHRAGPLRSDRKGGDQPTVYVPRAALSICGTIQPQTLSRVMSGQNIENGLLGRLLVTMPPTPRAHWNDNDVSLDTYNGWRDVVNGLLNLGCPDEPAELRLSPDAWPVWRQFHDAMVDRGALEDDQLAAALAKLRGGALRIALVLALARAAGSGRAEGLTTVDCPSMKAGIALEMLYGHEVERVYATLHETPEQRSQNHIIEFIMQSGGRVTVRDLSRGPQSCRPPGSAEAALMALVKAGRGSWAGVPSGPNGGAPTRQFVLEKDSQGDRTPEISGKNGVPVPSPPLECSAEDPWETPPDEPGHEGLGSEPEVPTSDPSEPCPWCGSRRFWRHVEGAGWRCWGCDIPFHSQIVGDEFELSVGATS